MRTRARGATALVLAGAVASLAGPEHAELSRIAARMAGEFGTG